MVPTSLEIVLTRPARVFISKYLRIENQAVLKRYAFAVALINCVCAGTIILFSLWTPYFASVLNYSQVQINVIGGMSSIGMYLLLPIIGNLADIYGTVLLSLLAIATFVPSYYGAALIYEAKSGYIPMTVCFCAIGFGTSCLYFAGLLTCANIYPDIKGLSISLPVTCYGLSPLIFSKLIQKVPWFHTNTEDVLVLDMPKIFRFLCGLYLVIGFLSYTASCILTIEKLMGFVDHLRQEVLEQDLLLNDNDSTLEPYAPVELLQNLLTRTASYTSYSSLDLYRNDDLINEVDSINKISHTAKYRQFLHDRSAYVFLAAFFLCVGPLEMYINNMGSLIQLVNTLNHKDLKSELLSRIQPGKIQPGKIHDILISEQVSYHSLFSTVIRLAISGLSDMLALKSRSRLFFKQGLCRVWLLVAVLIIGVLDQGLIVYLLMRFKTPNQDMVTVSPTYTLVSALAGISYGGVFTLYPSIIASIWGLDILGSTWGLYMVAPAFSSILFGIIYARIYDFFTNYKVYTLFVVTGACLMCSSVLILLTWKLNWSKRGFLVF